MKILMVVAYFVPEIGSAAHVYYDLARSFVRERHEVDVITSYPRTFNLGQEDKGKDFPLEEEMDGIQVHRCKHITSKDNTIIRGIEHFLLPRTYFKTYKRLGKEFDGCIFYIPPLPLYRMAKKIRSCDGTPSILNFQDFHPQELVDVGVLKNRLLIKIMERLEKKAYKSADYITVLSEKGVDYVINRGADPDKVEHIYNGTSPQDIEKRTERADFKEKEGIEDKFLVSYAGILSPFQGLDNILDVAKRLKDIDDIIFYIVGDGMIKDRLHNRVAEEDIENIEFLPFQPREEYFNIVNSSDASIVSLDERMKAPCLPGKIINLMVVGQPIIANVAPDTETSRVVHESGSGIVTNPGDQQQLQNAILKLYENPSMKREKGRNGKLFSENHMNLEESVEHYEELFERLNQGEK